MKKFLTKSNILIFVCVFMVLICLIFAVILYNRSNSNASIWGRKITCEGKISLSASSSYIDNSGTNWNSDISKTVGNYKYTLNGANAKLHVHGYTNSTSPGVSIYLSGSSVSDSTKGDFGYSNLNTKYQVCYSVDSHYSISISCSGNVPANLSEWKDSTFINWDSSTLSNKATYNTETTSDTSCKVTMTVTPKNYTQNFYLINPTENKKNFFTRCAVQKFFYAS